MKDISTLSNSSENRCMGQSQCFFRKIKNIKTYGKLFRITVSVMLLISWTVRPAFPTDTVRLSSGEWPPYTSQHLAGFGIASEIVTETFHLAGYNVEYEFFPWKRSYQLAINGDRDGSVVWQRTPEREEHALFSSEVITSRIVFVYRKNNKFDWKSLSDLKGKRIGTTRGYTYTTDFRERMEDLGVKLIDSDDDLTNLKLLVKGRIDVHPLDINVARYLINNHFSPKEAKLFAFHPLPLVTVPLFLMLPKTLPESKQLLMDFNKALKQIKKNGRHHAILTKPAHMSR